MEEPQPLPFRRAAIDAESVDEFAALQPERRRSSIQIHRGHFHVRLREVSWGRAALQEERWESGIRVRCNRATDFVAFALITQADGSARWNGAPLVPGTLVRITGPWEATSGSLLEFVGFGFGRTVLDAAEAAMRGPDQDLGPARVQDRLTQLRDPGSITAFLRQSLRLLEQSRLEPVALTLMENELIHLAVRLDREGDEVAVRRLSHPSRRRTVVRRIEEYVEASGDIALSIPTLCEIAGTSERTLEYAFREQIGITPARYLKLRRMNLVRIRLRDPESSRAGVTRIALDCGFSDLGRFAGEYRALFGEAPSETLAQARSRKRASIAAG